MAAIQAVAVSTTFILAMLMHPQVQATAQAELDSVLGRGQLPAFGDEEKLPYLMAVVKESLRWQVALPFSIPHTLMEDDDYKGFYIGKSSLIIPNTWQAHRFPHSRFLSMTNEHAQGSAKRREGLPRSLHIQARAIY